MLIRVSRAGINFADTHARENAYLAKYELPLTPGGEVAGVRDADDRRTRGRGDARHRRLRRVRRRPEGDDLPDPDGLDDGAALALVIQGLTAWHLYRTAREARRGRDAWSSTRRPAASAASPCSSRKPMGAGRVIATASSEEKRELALELGADAAIDAGGRGPDGPR